MIRANIILIIILILIHFQILYTMEGQIIYILNYVINFVKDVMNMEIQTIIKYVQIAYRIIHMIIYMLLIDLREIVFLLDICMMLKKKNLNYVIQLKNIIITIIYLEEELNIALKSVMIVLKNIII